MLCFLIVFWIVVTTPRRICVVNKKIKERRWRLRVDVWFSMDIFRFRHTKQFSLDYQMKFSTDMRLFREIVKSFRMSSR